MNSFICKRYFLIKWQLQNQLEDEDMASIEDSDKVIQSATNNLAEWETELRKSKEKICILKKEIKEEINTQRKEIVMERLQTFLNVLESVFFFPFSALLCFLSLVLVLLKFFFLSLCSIMILLFLSLPGTKPSERRYLRRHFSNNGIRKYAGRIFTLRRRSFY